MTGDSIERPPNPLLDAVNPNVARSMRELIDGALRTQVIYVLAKLGVADQLSLGPESAEALAQRLAVHPDRLRRVLRFAATLGALRELDDKRFELTPGGEYLQTAHPRSLRPSAIRAGEGFWSVVTHLLDAVRTGQTPHDELHQQAFFERLTARDGDAAFGTRMGGSAGDLARKVATLDCVARARVIVDVGGGNGTVLATLLTARPQLHGVLLDVPAALEVAGERLAAAGVRDRCTLVAGDFFEAIPSGGDVYLLSWILHDWDDERAQRVLHTCRDAGGESASLLVAEIVMPGRAGPRDAAALPTFDPFVVDLQMLLLTGGRERTEDEYRALFATARYELTTVHAVQSIRGVSIFEATPVS